MNISCSLKGWTDELDTARSVPLRGLKALGESHQLVFLGELGLELAEQLGFQPAHPHPFPYLAPWLGDLAAWPSYAASDRKERAGKADIIVFSDRWRSQALSYDLNYLRQLCMSLNIAVIFPARVQSRPVAMQWRTGFSWPESIASKFWIWCDSVGLPYAEAHLHNATTDTLSVRLKFSCISFNGHSRAVYLAINGKAVTSTLTPDDTEVYVDISPGENKLVWTTDGTSCVDAGGRSISFAVCDFEVLHKDGTIVLDRHVAYDNLQDSESDSEMDDLLLRKRLHEAGFVSVGGILRNGHGISRAAKMPKTTGSPPLPRPYDCDRDQWFYGGQYQSSDIAWFVASPLVGDRFNEVVDRLSNDSK
jgi:hypothetical protein